MNNVELRLQKTFWLTAAADEVAEAAQSPQDLGSYARAVFAAQAAHKNLIRERVHATYIVDVGIAVVTGALSYVASQRKVAAVALGSLLGVCAAKFLNKQISTLIQPLMNAWQRQNPRYRAIIDSHELVRSPFLRAWNGALAIKLRVEQQKNAWNDKEVAAQTLALVARSLRAVELCYADVLNCLAEPGAFDSKAFGQAVLHRLQKGAAASEDALVEKLVAAYLHPGFAAN